MVPQTNFVSFPGRGAQAYFNAPQMISMSGWSWTPAPDVKFSWATPATPPWNLHTPSVSVTSCAQMILHPFLSLELPLRSWFIQLFPPHIFIVHPPTMLQAVLEAGRQSAPCSFTQNKKKKHQWFSNYWVLKTLYTVKIKEDPPKLTTPV